jgi:hypothetical protein
MHSGAAQCLFHSALYSNAQKRLRQATIMLLAACLWIGPFIMEGMRFSKLLAQHAAWNACEMCMLYIDIGGA